MIKVQLIILMHHTVTKGGYSETTLFCILTILDQPTRYISVNYLILYHQNATSDFTLLLRGILTTKTSERLVFCRVYVLRGLVENLPNL